jgi:hypothetical protein
MPLCYHFCRRGEAGCAAAIIPQEFSMPNPRRLLLVVLLLAGCASTSITDTWRDPAYQGGQFKRVMVLGVFQQPTVRRTFEDIFSAKLRATGIEAIPSYQALPLDAPPAEGALGEAATRAGADGLLMVHLLRIDRQVRVTPAYAPAIYPGFHGYYSAWMAYPDVYTYDIVSAEVNLFEVNSKRLVWGGMTETFNPQSVSRESAGFADVVIAALAKDGLVRAPK